MASEKAGTPLQLAPLIFSVAAAVGLIGLPVGVPVPPTPPFMSSEPRVGDVPGVGAEPGDRGSYSPESSICSS